MSLAAATGETNHTTNPTDYVQAVLNDSQTVDITGMYYGTAYASKIDASVLPPSLQTALNTCTNDSTCNVIAYDPMNDFASGYQRVGYTLNTSTTTGDDSLVLVKNTTSVPSLVSPAGYTFTPWAVEDWGGNPSPPGASTNIMSGGPYFETQDACARRCDSTAGCLGFDFNAMNSGCYLYSGTGANTYSESYVGFMKNPTLVVGGTTPTGSYFTNAGSTCLQMNQCNKDLQTMTHNEQIHGFSTRELASCQACPVRSFQRTSGTSFQVANEIGTVTSYSSADDAYAAIQYTTGTPATHIDFATVKKIQAYMCPSVTASISVTSSGSLYTVSGLDASLGSSFSAFIVPYVTNGYILQSSTGGYLTATCPNGPISLYSTTQLPNMYSADYNACIFIVASS
jgi:PAN domain